MHGAGGPIGPGGLNYGVAMPEERETSMESLVVLRCSECGDTFPVQGGDQVCPSCGSAEVDAASEPLL